MSSLAPSFRSSARPSRLALSLLAALAAAPLSHAANAAWTADADGAWSDAANWNPAAAPGDTAGLASTDVATFNKTLTAARTVTVDANRNVSGITFNQTSAFGYTLSGGPILLSSGGLIQATNSSGTHTDVVAAPIVIQGDGGVASFGGNATSTTQNIHVTGDVSGVSTAGKTTVLTLFGFNSSTYQVSGLVSDGTAGGKLAITKGGSGSWRLNNPANTFSGGVTTSGSGAISFGASSIPTTGTVTSGPAGTGPLTLGGGFIQTVGHHTLANTISVSANTTTNVRGTSNSNITLTGPITGTGVFQNNHTTNASAIIQGDISGFIGTFSHTTNNNGNNFTFNGDTVASQNGSAARFVLAGTGTNRGLNVGSAAAPVFQIGELTGTGGRIVPNLPGVTLQVGALNTSPAAPFAGTINGELALDKVGTGTLTLSGTSPHTGATTVSAGTLRVGGTLSASPVTVASGAALSGEGSLGGALTLEAGATLRADAGTAGALTAGGLVLNGTTFLTLDGAPVTPALAQTVRALDYSGALSGPGSLITSGLRNASLNTGTPGQIDVTFDTLALTWSGESGAWAVGTAGNWNAGADVFFQGDVVAFTDLGANKNITLTGSAFPAAVSFSNSSGNDYVIGGSGTIGGTTGLTKDGTGAVTLTGAHSYTGATTVNAGNLTVVNIPGSLSLTGGALTVTGTNGLSGSSALAIPAGAYLALAADNNFTGATTLDGTLHLESLRSIASTASFALNTGGSLQLRRDTDGTFVTPTIAVASGGTASVDVGALTTGAPVLSLGTVKLTGTGSVASILEVTGAAGASLALTTASIENNSTVSSPISRSRLVLKPLSADLTVGSITGVSAGGGRDTEIVLDGTATGRITTRISNASGGGWMSVYKQGESTWILSGTGSNYAGNTTIASGGGILRVDSATALSSASTSNVQSFKGGTATGTLQFNVPGGFTYARNISSSSSSTFGAGGTATLQNLQGATTLSGILTVNGTGGSGMNIQSDVGGSLLLTGTLRNNVANSNRLFDLGGAGDGEVSGIITDGTATAAVTSIMKEGSGTWTISGAANTYTGNTTINGGTLAVVGAGGLGASSIVFNTGGTLDVSAMTAATLTAANGLGGSGVLNAAGKTVEITGAFTPGALAITGNVTLGAAGTSTFVADPSLGGSTAVSVTGALQTGGALNIVPAEGQTFATGQSFTFLSATGGLSGGYASVSVNGTPLTETMPDVWTGTLEELDYTYTEATSTLVVSGGAVSLLQAWRDTYFPSAGNDGTGIGALDADPDGDGLSNLLEYATGTVPTTTNPSAVTIGTSAGKLTLTYARVDDPALTYTVEGRNDLASGAWATVTASNNPSVGGTTSVTVEDEVAISAQPRRFLRLSVTLAP